jgi:hypothetical protein
MSELGTLPRCTAWSVANRIGADPAPSLTAKLKPFAWAFLYALKQQGFLELEVNYAARTTDQEGVQRHTGAAALSDWQRLEMAIWAWARALAGSGVSPRSSCHWQWALPSAEMLLRARVGPGRAGPKVPSISPRLRCRPWAPAAGLAGRPAARGY